MCRLMYLGVIGILWFFVRGVCYSFMDMLKYDILLCGRKIVIFIKFIIIILMFGDRI